MFSRLEIGPILRAMTRNKVGAILIAIQIAVTMTIIVNAIFIINERSELMGRASGVDEANSFYLTSTGFATDFNAKTVVQEDLNTIRQTPGVKDAIQINAIPISGGGWSMSLQVEPGEGKDDQSAAIYMVDEHGLEALDVELLAGDNFLPTDVRWREPSDSKWASTAIITQALAEALFPDITFQQVVGKTIYISEVQPILVKGVIDKLQAPWVGWSSLEQAMLAPELMNFTSTRYYIRTEPGMRDKLMPQIEDTLASGNKDRIIRNMNSVEETRERSYRQHSAMIKILTTVMVILTIVTGLGIVGLASFSVSRRKKQIGTRRALGASQTDIVRYFLIENFMITSVGVLLGAAMTVGLNIILVNNFEMDTIDWTYIPVGMIVLWLVGLFAAFGPAKKAASIAPAIATRTV